MPPKGKNTAKVWRRFLKSDTILYAQSQARMTNSSYLALLIHWVRPKYEIPLLRVKTNIPFPPWSEIRYWTELGFAIGSNLRSDVLFFRGKCKIWWTGKGKNPFPRRLKEKRKRDRLIACRLRSAYSSRCGIRCLFQAFRYDSTVKERESCFSCSVCSNAQKCELF